MGGALHLVRSFLGLVACLSLLAGAASARDLSGYAFINDDASLEVQRRTVHLYGIYIPPDGRTCRTFIRPAQCAGRATLALKFKVRGFVVCQEVSRGANGDVYARCWVGRTPFDTGDDLAEYLLEQGWALARPEAPFEYHALERIARSRQRGIWSGAADIVH